MQRVAQAKLVPLTSMVLWTTTEALLNDHGPLAPIWLQALPQRSQGEQTSGLFRQSMFKVNLEKENPER